MPSDDELLDLLAERIRAAHPGLRDDGLLDLRLERREAVALDRRPALRVACTFALRLDGPVGTTCASEGTAVVVGDAITDWHDRVVERRWDRPGPG